MSSDLLIRSKLYSFAKLIARHTIGLVYSIAYFIEPITEAQGMTFHSLSIFCRGRALSLYSISHLVTQARTLFFHCSILNYFKILLRYVLIVKTYQASRSRYILKVGAIR